MSKVPSENRCQHTSPVGRPCRTPRTDGHPSLCSYHARQEQRQKNDDPQALALDLLGPVHDFRSAASINHVLGKLLVLLATDRIPPRNAAVVAYICQLLLLSLKEVKQELWNIQNSPNDNSPEMTQALNQILNAPPMTLSPSEATKGQVSKFESARSIVAGSLRATP